MELYERKYLDSFGGPYEECCCVCSLRTGVVILAVLEIIRSVLSAFYILLFFLSGASASEDSLIFDEILFIFLTLDIVFFISAVLAIKGVNEVKIQWVYQYYLLSLIRLLLIAALMMISLLIFITSKTETYPAKFIMIIITFVAIAISLAINKVIWSAYVRLENNETVLVQHGKAMANLMNTQGRGAFSSPENLVAAGQPIQEIELESSNHSEVSL